MLRSLLALLLLLLPFTAAGQLLELDLQKVGDDCGARWISYPRVTASPGRYFSARPDACNLVNPRTVEYSIHPPLPPGLTIHRTTGRVSGWPRPNASDHEVTYVDFRGRQQTAYPGTVRTVTATWPGVFGRPMSATASFRYSFVDARPLETQSYLPIIYQRGEGVQRSAARVEGGTPPYRFQMRSVLPQGYRLEADGDLVGRPDDPHANCVGGCREWVQVTDALGRSSRVFALVTNAEQYRHVDRTCYVLVHGHGPQDISNEAQLRTGRDYWSKDRRASFHADLEDSTSSAGPGDGRARGFVETLTANGDLVYFVGYNSKRFIESVASEVSWGVFDAIWSMERGANDRYAAVIGGDGCLGAESVVVVAHSLGGVAMDYILGNADPNRARHRGVYGLVAAGVDGVVTIQSPHRGSELADAKCDFELSDLVHPLVLATYLYDDECDDGSWDLQTSEEIRRKSGPLARPTWAIGSHQGLCLDAELAESACWVAAGVALGTGNPAGLAIAALCPFVDRFLCSNTFYDEQNDGVVEYTSAFACEGQNPDDDAGQGFGDFSTDVCGNHQKVIGGLFNFDASEENHDTGRNGHHPTARRLLSVRDSIWSGLPRRFRPATHRMSSAAAIHHVFGAGAWLHLEDR